MPKNTYKYSYDPKFCAYCAYENCCVVRRAMCPSLMCNQNHTRTIDTDGVIDDILPAQTRTLPVCEDAIQDTGNDVEFLDNYHNSFINDCLKQIRNNELAFVYKMEHVKELMRFEPSLMVKYHDGAYCVQLPKIKVTKHRRSASYGQTNAFRTHRSSGIGKIELCKKIS